MKEPAVPRLLVLACDALDPELILTHLHRLPFLRSLCEEGAYGVVQSAVHSCDIWTTHYTGLAPEQHGIQFSRLGLATKPADLSTVKTDLFLWDWLNRHGLSVGFLEALHTYPAPKVDGFFISGSPRPGLAQTDRAVHPPQLRPLIDREYVTSVPRPPNLSDLGVSKPFSALSDQELLALLDGYFADAPDRLRPHLEWYLGLVERLWAHSPCDVLWLYFIEADILGHFTFNANPPEVLVQVYEEMDRAFARLVERLRPETVMLLSDHGMASIASVMTQPQSSLLMQRLAGEYRVAGARLLRSDLAVVEGYNGGLSTGTHRDQAFYAVRGPRVQAGTRADAHFHDLFRLIVRVLGLPVPAGRVGKTPPVLTEFSGRRASQYDRLSWARNQGYLDAFLRFADPQSEQRVLEIGVGTGTVAAHVQPYVARFVGVDNAPEMLKIARQKHPGISLLQADSRDLPFADEEFDLVLARSVLHHMTMGLDESVAECYRVLKPGGTFVIGEGIPPSTESVAHFTEVFSLKEERLVLLPEHLVLLLERAGFVDLQFSTYVVPQVSVRNWLDQSDLSPQLKAHLLELHRTTPPAVQRAYRTVVADSDVLIDFTFALVRGRKPTYRRR